MVVKLDTCRRVVGTRLPPSSVTPAEIAAHWVAMIAAFNVIKQAKGWP